MKFNIEGKLIIFLRLFCFSNWNVIASRALSEHEFSFQIHWYAESYAISNSFCYPIKTSPTVTSAKTNRTQTTCSETFLTMRLIHRKKPYSWRHWRSPRLDSSPTSPTLSFCLLKAVIFPYGTFVSFKMFFVFMLRQIFQIWGNEEFFSLFSCLRDFSSLPRDGKLFMLKTI